MTNGQRRLVVRTFQVIAWISTILLICLMAAGTTASIVKEDIDTSRFFLEVLDPSKDIGVIFYLLLSVSVAGFWVKSYIAAGGVGASE